MYARRHFLSFWARLRWGKVRGRADVNLAYLCYLHHEANWTLAPIAVNPETHAGCGHPLVHTVWSRPACRRISLRFGLDQRRIHSGANGSDLRAHSEPAAPPQCFAQVQAPSYLKLQDIR